MINCKENIVDSIWVHFIWEKDWRKTWWLFYLNTFYRFHEMSRNIHIFSFTITSAVHLKNILSICYLISIDAFSSFYQMTSDEYQQMTIARLTTQGPSFRKSHIKNLFSFGYLKVYLYFISNKLRFSEIMMIDFKHDS